MYVHIIIISCHYNNSIADHICNDVSPSSLKYIMKLYLWFSPCLVGDCEVLDDPINGMVTVDGLSVGSTAIYECDPGFVLIGSEQRICQEDGVWSGTPPICTCKLF